MSKRNKKPNPKVLRARPHKAPVAKSRQTRTPKPRMSNSKRGTRITHRELVSEITATNAYMPHRFAVNPGMSSPFLWLSGVARNFQNYKIESLRFELETEAPTTTAGSCMLAFLWDASLATPSSKVQLMSVAGAQRTAIWDELSYNVPMRNNPERIDSRYVRSDDTALSHGDIKTFDLGALVVATQGGDDNNSLELYVTYTILLSNPAEPTLGKTAIPHTTTHLRTNQDHNFTTSEPVPWKAASATHDSIGLEFVDEDNLPGVFSLPYGSYEFKGSVTGSPTSGTADGLYLQWASDPYGPWTVLRGGAALRSSLYTGATPATSQFSLGPHTVLSIPPLVAPPFTGDNNRQYYRQYVEHDTGTVELLAHLMTLAVKTLSSAVSIPFEAPKTIEVSKPVDVPLPLCTEEESEVSQLRRKLRLATQPHKEPYK